MRLDYPPNVKIIKVPCTGRVDVIHILKALEDGADGVMVAGCMEGDCHYQSGNLRAKKRVTHVQQILEQIGFGAERVAMYNLSAGMGVRFAEIAREITEKVKELGPNPIRSAREASGQSTKEAVHG
jgi:coenzyme F420-reducing hydrogenase delta subunit